MKHFMTFFFVCFFVAVCYANSAEAEGGVVTEEPDTKLDLEIKPAFGPICAKALEVLGILKSQLDNPIIRAIVDRLCPI